MSGAQPSSGPRYSSLAMRVGDVLTSSLEPAATLRRLGALLTDEMGDACLIYLVDAAGDPRLVEVVVGAAPGVPGREQMLRRCLPEGPEHPVRRAVDGRRPIRAVSAPCGCCGGRCTEARGAEPELPYAVVPLVEGERVLGALAVVSVTPGRGFGEDELDALVRLAPLVARTLDHQRLYQAASQAVRVREEIMARVAHDLGPPLKLLRQGLHRVEEGLGEPGPEPHPLLRLVQAMGETVARMAGQVDDLVDVEQIRGGRVHLDVREHAVDPLVREAVRLARQRSPSPGVRAAAFVEPASLTFPVDATRFVQIVDNLVGNALAASPAGQTVRVLAGTSDDGDTLHLRVEDRGDGPPRPGSATRGEPGPWSDGVDPPLRRGLGLHIVQGLVDAHGGRVAWRAREWGGTRVEVRLPRTPAST